MAIVWNPTKIDQATYCLMQYYLINIEKVKVPQTGRMAEGIFLHKVMEKFYTVDKETKLKRPKYKSAEAFANAASARWTFIIKRGTIQSKRTEWEDKNEPWILREDIKKICKTVYGRYAQQEPPVYVEVPFNFRLDGRRYNGRMDEIRVGPAIRDHKSGHRKPGQMKLNYDPQFTLYALALGCFCSADEKFARSVGVSPEEAAQWAGNPIYLSPRMGLEYYFMREDKIFDMRRSNLHYDDFCRMLDGLEKQIESGNIYPERGRLCDYCSVRRACDARTAGITVPVKKDIQLKLFSPVPYIKRVELKKEKQLKLFKRRKKKKIQA